MPDKIFELNLETESAFQLVWRVDEDKIPINFSKGVMEGIKE